MIRQLSLPAIALFCPLLVFADLTQTPVLSSGQTLDLETGAISSSGGDFKFNGTSITFVGNATEYVIGRNLAAGGYALINEGTLMALSGVYTKTAISGGDLAVGTVFAVYTNGQHYAKVLIQALSGTSLTVQFLTYGATGGVPDNAPKITAIQNNYSNVIMGEPNYGITPSTLFVIYGSGLADPTAQAALQSSQGSGIPLTLNGASITVTVNGTVTHPGIYYAVSTQIAAVLPAATPLGTGTLTVTYNNVTSAAFTIQVVQSALGFDTFSGFPSGLAAATDPLSPTGALFTLTSSAKPGQVITLWGTGLGPNPADSDTKYTSPPHMIDVPLTIYIGGIQAQILYAGGSGYPGLVQINLYVPNDVTPGCGVPIVGVVGNVVSNTVTIPVAADGGVCQDVVNGIDGGMLSSTPSVPYTSGVLTVAEEVTTKTTSVFAGGGFSKVTALQYVPDYATVTPGNCVVFQNNPPATTTTSLDAGNITVSGPGGTYALTKLVTGSTIAYEMNLPTTFFPQTGGTYTFQGSGGPDVPQFSVTVTNNSPLVWTNQNSITSVDRTQPLTVTWTGGVPGTYVAIGGGSTTIGVSGTFICYAPVSAGQFTIPSYVLLASPVGDGGINLLNQSPPQSFPAAGLNTTYATAEVELSVDVPFK